MEKISPFYNDAVQQIKSAILESQLETARAANKQMLSLYSTSAGIAWITRFFCYKH